MYSELFVTGLVLGTLAIDIGATLNRVSHARWHSGKTRLLIQATLQQKVRVVCGVVWRSGVTVMLLREPPLTGPAAAVLTVLVLWVIIQTERILALLLSLHVARFPFLLRPWFRYVSMKSRIGEWTEKGWPRALSRTVVLMMLVVPLTYVVWRVTGTPPS